MFWFLVLAILTAYLEIEGLVTVEDKDKASKLVTKSLDGLCLSCPRRTWWTAEKMLRGISKIIQSNAKCSNAYHFIRNQKDCCIKVHLHNKLNFIYTMKRKRGLIC